MEYEYVDDPHAELVRKVAWLKWGSIIETVSYLLLLTFWLSGHDLLTAMVGSLHGMIWMGFVGMLVGLRVPMRWTWTWVALAVVTGPIGAVLVYERIRRQGVPEDATAR
ncbi:MAG TPA: DUF3817 domain-containing protein [Acidimicrobiales bacterium]|nr:DUF3817 domain-containing protein [Acidimicrobiales bacterium]